MGDAHEERALLKIFAMQSGSDYLPWIARAARRVQGPCSGTFRKLGTARSSSSSLVVVLVIVLVVVVVGGGGGMGRQAVGFCRRPMHAPQEDNLIYHPAR